MPSKTWSELLNDAEAEGGGFSVIPEDDYDFVISKSEARKTQKGKDMFVIQAKVIDGPSKNRVVFYNFVISPESPISLRIFFQQMRVLGLTGENLFNNNPTAEQIAAALFGKVFRGTVKIEKDNKDQDRNVIKNFSTIPDAELGRVQAAAQAIINDSGSGAPVGNATPSGGSASQPPAPAPQAPAPEAPAAPATPPAAPAAPAAPSAGSIPPPPPTPQF